MKKETPKCHTSKNGKKMGKGGEERRWGREEKEGDGEGRRRKEMRKGGEEKCDWERKRRKEE